MIANVLKYKGNNLIILYFIFYKSLLLQFKFQSIKIRKESCIGDYTRELDRVLVIKCLSYIYLANGLYYTNSDSFDFILNSNLKSKNKIN